MDSENPVNTNDEFIDKFIKDPDNRIDIDGTIWTKRSYSGKLQSNWRRIHWHRRKGIPTIHYYHKNLTVARLLYKNFIGDLIPGMIVCTKNGIQSDLNTDNLEQISIAENTRRTFSKTIGSKSPKYRAYIKEIQGKNSEVIFKIAKELNYNWTNHVGYDGIDYPCSFICEQSHKFSITGRRFIKGTVCPVCTKKIRIGENIAKECIEELTGIRLEKTRRIPGLICPQTGNKLEIDGFSLEHKLGMEYQGMQHYNYPNFFHKTRESFELLRARDGKKAEFFNEHGWTLLDIKEFSSFNKNDCLSIVRQRIVDTGLSDLIKKGKKVPKPHLEKQRENNKLILKLLADPNYDIRPNGEIWTRITKTGKVSVDGKWRLTADLKSNKCQHYSMRYKDQKIYKHRVIYAKFVGKLKIGLVIHHKDLNGFNNHYSNLEQVRLSTNNKWENRGYNPKNSNRLNFILAEEIRTLHENEKGNIKDLSQKFKVSESCIHSILNRKTYNTPQKQAVGSDRARANPIWANRPEINKFYKNCPEGMEVDHILPLRGENVSGLHVLENLRYLTQEENREKSNKTI